MCIVQDLQNMCDLLILPYISNWYNYMQFAATNVIFHLEHPENNFFYRAALLDFVAPHMSKIQFIIELETSHEGIILIPLVILDLI
jgi:hypothetical protein